MSAVMDKSRTPSRWSRICRLLYHSRLLGPLLATSSRRRVLVVLYAAVLAAFPVAAWSTGGMWSVALVGVLYLIGTLLVAVATSGVLDKPMRYLDERQQHVRRSLFRDPYPTGVALGLAGGMIIALSLDASDPVALGVFMFVFGLLFGLPSMLFAWSLSDPDDEDE